MQHVEAFELFRISDFQYLLENMDLEMDVDIYDPVQLLGALKKQFSEEENRSLTSMIQNVVVGTSMIDSSSRVQLLYIIERAVMHIVLDQNGMSNFTNTFECGVGQIIEGLSEIQNVREENEKLASIIAFQEAEMLNSNHLAVQDTVFRFDEGFEKELADHKKQLTSIYAALDEFAKKNQLMPAKLQAQISEMNLRNSATTISSLENVGALHEGQVFASLRFDSESTIIHQPSSLVLSPQGSLPTISHIISQIGIPAPPPPPPLNGLPGAPLPPNAPSFVVTTIPALKYKSKSKLRKIHWESIRISDDSVWHNLKCTKIADDFNESGFFTQLETQFQARPTTILKIPSVATSKAIKSNRSIGEKREQNICTFQII